MYQKLLINKKSASNRVKFDQQKCQAQMYGILYSEPDISN